MTRSQRRALRTSISSKVVVYARVSTDAQDQSGAGVEAQIAECLAYAERHGLTVVEIVREVPVSGKVHPSNRPGFNWAMGLLENCEAGTLLVRRMDRVSRKLTHTLDVVEASRTDGWAICTTDGKVDTSTASGRAHTNMMATFAEYERELIGERTREALAAKRAQGVRLGRPPVVTADVVARVLAERDAGMSMAAIAAALTADAVPTARGGAGWTKASVQSLLTSHRATVLALAAGARQDAL
jgi:DNA invertase Pin-like site-specific DNA recombinase